MGVLEDAIREHLDLKRQHGASDEELTQQEAEALGPARRELPESDAEDHAPETAEADAAVEALPVDTDPAIEPAVVPPPIEEASADSAQPEGGPLPVDPPPASEPAFAPPPIEEASADSAQPEGRDPDFGADAPDQTSRRDLDFD